MCGGVRGGGGGGEGGGGGGGWGVLLEFGGREDSLKQRKGIKRMRKKEDVHC